MHPSVEPNLTQGRRPAAKSPGMVLSSAALKGHRQRRYQAKAMAGMHIGSKRAESKAGLGTVAERHAIVSERRFTRFSRKRRRRLRAVRRHSTRSGTSLRMSCRWTHPLFLVGRDGGGRRPKRTPCSPSNAASKTTAGPKSSIEGFAAPQPHGQKNWNAPGCANRIEYSTFELITNRFKCVPDCLNHICQRNAI